MPQSRPGLQDLKPDEWPAGWSLVQAQELVSGTMANQMLEMPNWAPTSYSQLRRPAKHHEAWP